MSTKQKITINDIAAAAGVSKTTVSRYINGQTNLLKEGTIQKVKSVIELLDYTPNPNARKLKSKNSMQIGVVLSEMGTPFQSSLATGINRYLEKQGYDVIFVDSNQDTEKEAKLIHDLIAKDVSGILINTVSTKNNILIKHACQGFPVVLCDRYVDDYNFNIITIEQDDIMLKLMLHLKEQGYTKPMFFTPEYKNNSTRQRRRTAFIKAVLEVFGHNPTEDVFVIDNKDVLDIAEDISEIMDRLDEGEIPVVIGTNTDTTIKLYKALQQLNLQIPQDIGICGPEDWDWDNDKNWPTMLTPSFTTLYVPTKKMGYKAAELLLEIINDTTQKQREVVLECELRVRSSTLHLK